ncbi:MAG: leucyl aminopeptidase [Chitinivibrionales bacterium]|nr:leucyl aminopeptidase [Chitinivibrionales bacterium]
MKIILSSKAHHATIIKFMLADEAKRSPAPAIADFKGEKDEVAVRYNGDRTIIYCGLGEKSKYSTLQIRAAAARGIQKAIDLKRGDVSLVSPQVLSRGEAEACLEGVLLGADKFTKYKSDKPKTPVLVEMVTKSPRPVLRTLQAVCDGTLAARALVNENAHTIVPEYLARYARRICKAGKIACTVLDEKELARKGLGLIVAVGQGSPHPPRLIIMEYRGDKGTKNKTALIGKGVTFDSGGQNLKPTGSLETMRQDMAGGAAVLGIMQALGTMKPKINVVGIVPAVHNAIDGTAYFPGDIYKSYNGKTVEISSTDAEGRLILADAITYCQKHCAPSRIIDLATLTGAILVALGDTIAGLFCNNDELARALFNAGEKTGERLWRLPLYEEHHEIIKSDSADLCNTSKLKKGTAGSIAGAAFLEEFVENLPWAHLDIAGVAYNEKTARGEVPQFGTGFGVRLLLEYLLNYTE